MIDNNLICKRCILDSNIPDISFDENDVCNYCNEHDNSVLKFPLGEPGKLELNKIVECIKKSTKNNDYDCIVGVSGGVDSTYALYNTVKLGLRPLAVLFDNGWNSEIAVSNIKNATDKLNVDLETFVVDYEEFKSILVAFLKASVPDTDAPTDIGIKSTLYRSAIKNKVKYIITGGNFRTEGRMPRKWSYMDGRYIRNVYKIFQNKKIKNFPNLTLLDYFRFIFLSKIKVVGILNYIDYHRDKTKTFLEKELGWRDYGGKHFESLFTRFNQTYIRYKKFGIDPRLIEYSALVRSGQISRDQSFELINKSPYNEDQLENEVEYVIKKLGLSRPEFDNIYALPKKSFLNYPTYYPFINSLRPIVDFISKYIKRV